MGPFGIHSAGPVTKGQVARVQATRGQSKSLIASRDRAKKNTFVFVVVKTFSSSAVSLQI